MHHYEWMELKDFSAGMWTANDWQIPPTGAALLEDCYPLPGGGIRAFGKFGELTNSGIGNDEEILAFWVEDHVAGPDYICITTTGAAQKLYRMNVAAGATTWTTVKTFSLTANFSAQPYITSYRLLTEAEPHVYMVIGANGTDAGLWRLNLTSGAVARPTIVTTNVTTATLTGPICVHQDRLICAEEFEQIWYTEPGLETIGNTNTIVIRPSNRLNTLTFMKSTMPSDLLIATRGAPWTMIQDDITDHIDRSMSDTRHSAVRQIITEMDEGTAFQAVLDGIYVTPDGARFQKLSNALSIGDLWGDIGDELTTQCGSMAYLDNWLFHPSGHIYDTRTKAWFRTSYWSQSQSAFAIYANKRRTQHQIIACVEPDSGQPPKIYTLSPLEDNMSRVASYRYQSPSYHNPEGRQIEFGEINVVCKSFQNGASIDFTVNGVTRSVENIDAGRQVVPVLYRERGSQLDLSLTVKSEDAAVEAPSIELIRIGTLHGHLLRVS